MHPAEPFCFIPEFIRRWKDCGGFCDACHEPITLSAEGLQTKQMVENGDATETDYSALDSVATLQRMHNECLHQPFNICGMICGKCNRSTNHNPLREGDPSRTPLLNQPIFDPTQYTLGGPFANQLPDPRAGMPSISTADAQQAGISRILLWKHESKKAQGKPFRPRLGPYAVKTRKAEAAEANLSVKQERYRRTLGRELKLRQHKTQHSPAAKAASARRAIANSEARRRPVLARQYQSNARWIRYDSFCAAARALNCFNGGISSCIAGTRNQHHGYEFRLPE